ncbi:methionyl-tRNA formyltransferase [Crateriforma spongiae]|uniref:methionyl-tRNA formyltransferase n=1 Tax=Crateriforma spongiae TaxID=2724528 RepID=UPI0039AF1C9C
MSKHDARYLVMGRQPWNRGHFDRFLRGRSGDWDFCGDTDSFTKSADKIGQYDYVFVLHWSHKIETAILDQTPFVCFHMTDVPFGRGGSPLQNLIARGHRSTRLTALRMTPQFDAGPVYLKRDLSLEGGTAEEIYVRASSLACSMAIEIAEKRPVALDQTGDPVVFKRRKPADSELPIEPADLMSVFDHIRMLDAEGYPRAFLEIGNLRIEFDRAALYHKCIKTDAVIRLLNDQDRGNG